MSVLRGVIDDMLRGVTASQLFPTPAVIHFRSEERVCPVCHEPLLVLKTRPGKRAATLAIGEFIAHETVSCCRRCTTTYHSTELRSLIPQHCNFGYDVIVFVGESVFLRCRNYQDIKRELERKNIRISESEIAFLARKFVLYLGVLHRSVRRKTRTHMRMNGGYILHLDGTCDGASPHLISVLDGITEIVLDNEKMPSENAEQLIPFLRRIIRAYGVPLAVVSDMGKGIAAAVRTVLPHTPAFICHFHFLKAVGKTLLVSEHDIIRERLRKHRIRATLKRTAARLEKTLGATGTGVDALIGGLENERLPGECSLGTIPTQAAYTLIRWVLDAGAESDGCGFPFDQTYLVFYRRLQEAGQQLHRLFRIRLQGDWKENRVYSNISHDLVAVLNDQVLRDAALRMQEKVVVFNRLRTAMRITVPENRRGLNDTGEMPIGMKTIETEVRRFRSRLVRSKEYTRQLGYRKLVDQLDIHWEQLFADPIAVNTAAGALLVQPQRTNNILEQFFRRLMRTYRKKNGFASVEKVLQSMLADTPLVMNLNNKDYMRILLAGCPTLEARFAEVDSREIRKRMVRETMISGSACPRIKKIIRLPQLPQAIVRLLQHSAAS